MAKARRVYDLIILGAGASGLAAAIRARRGESAAGTPERETSALETSAFETEKARALPTVLLLEKNRTPGKKLRATGNGRCNISNAAAPHAARVLEFLRAEGMALTEYPSGLIYPRAESAKEAAELLGRRAERLGAEIRTETEVLAVEEAPFPHPSHSEARFLVKTAKGTFGAKNVLLALGGKSAPQFGTTGDGYVMARKLGLPVTRLIPVLTPVTCAEMEEERTRERLAGIRMSGSVRLLKRGEAVFQEDGEIQFTKDGLSGICIFNMTRHMRLEESDSMEDFIIEILPKDAFRSEEDGETMAEYLRRRKAAAMPKEPASEIFMTYVREGLASLILERAGVPETKEIRALSEEELSRIEEEVASLRFRPTRLHGWKEAQCTQGGIALTAVNEETGEILGHPGLYAAGEILDYDGPCGGWNLNHAIWSGIRAAEAVAASLKQGEE